MADAVALSEFRTRVRYKADIEVGASGSRFPDAEIDRYINEACKQLYNRLVRARGEAYYETSAKTDCIVGTALYNLPSDFAWLVGVRAWDGANDHCSVDPFDMSTLPDLLGMDTAGSIQELRYKLTPTQFELRPTPTSASWDVFLHYVPTMTEMSGPTDTFDGINGFEEWAVLTAAIACKTKDEEDPSALMAERAIQERLIEDLAGQRDAGRPATIQDTRRDHGAGTWTHAWLHDAWDY